MSKRGIVTQIKDGKLEIILARNSACGDCSTCGGCEAETINLKADNKIDAQVGDFVEIKYNSNKMIKSTILLYIFPLIMLLVGVIIGYKIQANRATGVNELAAFAVGMVMLLLSYFIINKIDKKVKFSDYFTIKKIEKLF